jgi:nucleoside-diphosphate-sugar epimerase
MATQINNILCIGGGLLGLPVAAHFSKSQQVTLLKRSGITDSLPISVCLADISDQAQLIAALPKSIDIILYCLSPAEFDDAGYRKVFPEGVGNILSVLKQRKQQPKRIFFVSSTSVYSQNGNDLITENSPALPTAFSGKRLQEAESLLLNSGIPTTIVRFSGIYGGNRTRLIEQALKGELSSTQEGPYTNRINEADCIGVLIHLMQKEIDQQPLHDLYVASDCEPVPTHIIAAWFRQHVHCDIESTTHTLSKRRAGSKRCSNQRLIDSGYTFVYPTWREGYLEMIQRLYPNKIKQPHP